MADADDSPKSKRCTRCGETKPLDAFSLCWSKAAKRRLPHTYCKPCAAERQAERRKASPPTEVEREKARERANRWYRENRERAIANVREYTENNRETIRAKRALYRLRNRDLISARKAEYREANREAIRQRSAERYKKNAALIALRVQEWRRNNRDGHRAQGALRRARKRSAGGVVTKEDIAVMHAGQKGKCWYCGASLKKTGYHVDHRIPLARGGTNDPENIVLACPPCNLRKGAKTPQEFVGRLL